MAQQLAATRSPASYAGVASYAHSHPGEAAAAAYLALGHANMLDHRFADAAANFQTASRQGDALADYADYLGAQAQLQAAHGAAAFALLNNFAARHPGSIFIANAPMLLANAYLQQNDPQSALRILQPLAATQQGTHADYRYALARANQLAGNAAEASRLYRGIYRTQPLTPEAAQARAQMERITVAPLTAAERKIHADQLFLAGRYTDAEQEYGSIRNAPGLSAEDSGALLIYQAVCQLKTKRLTKHDADMLPQTNDDSGAARLYILAELSRADGNPLEHRQYIDTMRSAFPRSHWLEEALYSGGNMYLLKRDYIQAIFHFTTLVQLFPGSRYAPSAHWRAAWMNYRLRNYSEAARLMDEQLQSYPGGLEIAPALYWRARIYEEQEHNFAQAANYYHTLVTDYPNYYYGLLGRQRLALLGAQPPADPAPFLSFVHPPDTVQLTDELPENDIHLIKARLLANAALNEYIAPEIQAGAGSATWGVLAQAEIYASYGENFRALQTMKRSGLQFFAYERAEVPDAYWHLLFPQPYWPIIVANAEKNNLDPYLVASLIRQESEFNPGAVSRANAYGLMQLLPSVGKSAAKREGDKHFTTPQLLDASTNIALGTDNLHQVLTRFNGQAEYALAAYNAGDAPVREWMSVGDYRDIPEFVESIPYSETRGYVQAIIRNREMYRMLYPAH
jgi:soluble lytic murein transglycosylase